jgi:hypothetical protein
MNAKLVTPELGPVDEDSAETRPPAPRPDLRVPPRRSEPLVDTLVRPGFVVEAPQALEPTEPTEVLTIEVPRRLKRALLAEVTARKDDPQRKTVASMKSVILEALTAYGFSEFIRRSDIEVQAGIFMKRQAAQLRRRG